jgi:hypothetical protein
MVDDVAQFCVEEAVADYIDGREKLSSVPSAAGGGGPMVAERVINDMSAAEALALAGRK